MCPALWQALYMDYPLYSSQPNKICALSLFSFYKWVIDARRGSVTCHSACSWNQEAGWRFAEGSPILGLLFSSSGQVWEFTARRATSLPAPYLDYLLFYTDPYGLYMIFIFSVHALNVPDWFWMMATVCFKEPEIKKCSRWAFLALVSLFCVVR